MKTDRDLMTSIPNMRIGTKVTSALEESTSDLARTSAGELSTVAQSLRVTIGRFHA
jgi:hypothetical protein